MSGNDGSSWRPSSAPFRPTITLPPRSSMESLFTGGPGASPGPMTLVSNFFSDNDPDSDYRSFSQLLAGAMGSPAAAPSYRPSFPPPADSSSKDKDSGGVDLRFKENRPTGLVIAHSPMFTVPPGLSPASLLDSPGWLAAGQAPFGMSHQQALAQVTAQAAQAHSQINNQTELPSSLSTAPVASMAQLPSLTSNMTTNQQMPPPLPDSSFVKESSDISHSEQRSQTFASNAGKPAGDGYNWRKYGQKQVKGSEYPRSYYKCTHPICPVKKQVESAFDGHVREIIYKGQHNHPPPQPSKCAKDTGNPSHVANSELAMEGQTGNLNKSKDGVPDHSLSMKDQESSQVTPDGCSDSEEVGDAETRVDERDEDEPEAKRRNTEVRVAEPASSHRAVAEPRIIVQTTSEVDLLDDGYRWKKYGQKVVKGNPYPRSYYKCTNPGCNVRKHVERAASDRKAVITTYEGKHNHNVPAARNSSHNTANNNNALALKQQSSVPNRHTLGRTTDFGGKDSQPIALLRFKEELA
ncbi:hypothetical protein NMG60_11009283 [Bertholletia excelsa]